MSIRTFRRAGAALAAGAVLAGGIASQLAPLAQAAPTIPDPGAAASLIIHKYKGATSNQANDGRTLTESDVTKNGATPLPGMAFDVYTVFYDAAHTKPVDLATNGGWTDAAAIRDHKPTQAEITAGQFAVGATTYFIGSAGQVTTGADGTATFDGPIGLYLVNENRAASQLTAEEKVGLTPAVPFFVTLPMTDPTNQTAWDYSVDVYPKNVVDSITKEVLDGNLQVASQDSYKVGENLTYRLESTINVSDTNGDGKVDGADLGYYEVLDSLDSHNTYQSATLTPVDRNGTDGAALAEGTDFTVTVDAATNRVAFALTASGLDKIAGFGDGHLRTDLVAQVTTEPDDGIVPNTAAFIPSNGWLVAQDQQPGTPGTPTGPGVPDIPSNKVQSEFGDIVLKKVDETGQPLAGAVFQVYRSNTDGSCAPDPTAGGVLAGTSAESGTDGLTVIKGLQLSDWYNGSAQAAKHTWCIVETKAPAGYELAANPIAFDLTVPGSVTDLSAAFADANRDANVTDNAGGTLQIANQPHNLGNPLPLTGGAGTAAAAVGGLALVGGAAAVYAVKRRRDHKAVDDTDQAA